MTQNKDIEKAVKKMREQNGRYAKTMRYYDGQHDLAFASEKFKNAFGDMFREFSLNLCPAVVDAVKDKLIITGFQVENGSEEIADHSWKIWQQNRMGKRSGEIHKEAVKSGDAYAIVWPDANGRVTIYPQKASNCTVQYDEETPGNILWAAKSWKVDKRYRLNLMYPDRIEKYISKQTRNEASETSIQYEPFGTDWKIKNRYGRVPVFHFANNSDVGDPGRSELHDVIPIQDALNKSVLDMLVAMEFASFRQRWISGIEIDYDEKGEPIAPFKSGAEKIWLTESVETKFGDFEATDLEQFLKVKENFKQDVAGISGTPIYYFMQTGANFPQSGESYRRAETRFIRKVRDRQEAFGNVWEDVISFALMIDGKGTDVRLFAQWEAADQLTEKEQLDNLVTKKELGVSPTQLLTEAGYGIKDIEAMLDEIAEREEASIRRFNAGEA